jgi:hypothetical protein
MAFGEKVIEKIKYKSFLSSFLQSKFNLSVQKLSRGDSKNIRKESSFTIYGNDILHFFSV